MAFDQEVDTICALGSEPIRTPPFEDSCSIDDVKDYLDTHDALLYLFLPTGFGPSQEDKDKFFSSVERIRTGMSSLGSGTFTDVYKDRIL